MDDDGIQKPTLLVQEYMSVLARRIRVDQKEAALAIDSRLTTFGHKLLVALRENGPMTASSAAERLDVDRSVVSRHLRPLTTLGLVTSAVDDRDGRMRLIALTELASVRLEDQERNELTRLQRALVDWSDDDLARFANYLGRLIRSDPHDEPVA
jgi:DNA-binding MarR family transcriptional regulator